jgi:hypothetical protein
MANQDLPGIKGYPPREVLGCRTINLVGYSYESMDITTYSMIISSLMVDLSMSWRTLGVSLRPVSPKACMVLRIMTLMESPRHINVFIMSVLLIFKLTIGMPRSKYFDARTQPIIKSDNLPITWKF